MFILWFRLETDPDSDYSDAYAYRIIQHLTTFKEENPRRMMWTSSEHLGRYLEISIFEIWFATVDDAMLFKLAWPFTGVKLLIDKPSAEEE